MNDEQLYLEATQEVDNGTQDPALWAKAMALAEGDEGKARYRYITLRVEQWSSTSEKTSSTEPSTSPCPKAAGESIPEDGSSHAGDAWDKKVLTEEIAEELLADRYGGAYELDEFTTLEAAAAESLSKHKDELYLKWDILHDEVLELIRTGKYDRGVVVAKKALEVAEKNVGPNHPDVATSLNNLAELYRVQGHYAQAEPLYKRSLAIDEKALGPDHPSVATSLNTKASVKRSLGKLSSSVEKQLDKGKTPVSMSKLIVKLVGYSSDPDHKKYVPVDQANTLILASAKYLSCLNGQSCTFTSTTFDDLRGTIDNLTTSNKTKKKLNKLLSKVEIDGPTVQLAERVGLTKVISMLVGKSTKLSIPPGEANDLIFQVAHVMTRF